MPKKICNSDSGGREEAGRGASGARFEACRRGRRQQGFTGVKDRLQQGPLRAERLRRYKRRQSRRGRSNRVASNHPRAHGGARTLSKGVKKLSSNFRILASALARASGASSNTSRVKVTRGICV
jgi:hypothetical protein